MATSTATASRAVATAMRTSAMRCAHFYESSSSMPSMATTQSLRARRRGGVERRETTTTATAARCASRGGRTPDPRMHGRASRCEGENDVTA
mmetsp:Transcript_7124/g.26072  ORF Transcript_7124/g.26072 Transcript_7124/m.26072 type:complete len:92 (+) Transcript_7124:1633-1908(+)